MMPSACLLHVGSLSPSPRSLDPAVFVLFFKQGCRGGRGFGHAAAGQSRGAGSAGAAAGD